MGLYPSGGRDWSRNEQGAKAMLEDMHEKEHPKLKSWEKKAIKITLCIAVICQIIYAVMK